MTTIEKTRKRRMDGVDWFGALRSPRECDVRYRLSDGTALEAAKAGLVKSSVRPHSRGGRTNYFIDPRDAERVWGAK